MTNQAAQTMPELPVAIASIHADGYWTTDDRRPDWKWPARQRVFSVDQMHQYARDYAAALSRTAGVADGWTREDLQDLYDRLVSAGISKFMEGSSSKVRDREFIRRAITEAWGLIGDMLAAAPAASGVDTSTNEAWAARAQEKIAAMDAASGGEGPTLHPATEDLIRRFSDALREKLSAAEKKYGYSDGWASPDWMDQCRRHLDQHVAKGDPRDVAAYCAFLWHHGESTTPQPPSAASVSERARTASLKEIVPAEKRNYLDDNGNPRSIEDEAYAHGWNACRAATIRTLEQALTQQRGGLPSAKTLASAVLRDWMTNEQADKLGAELHAWLGAYVATTPQPSADAVREVPDGMVLVPREPDVSVVHAMREAYRSVRRGGIGGQTLDASFQREYAPELAAYYALLSAASGEKGVG